MAQKLVATDGLFSGIHYTDTNLKAYSVKGQVRGFSRKTEDPTTTFKIQKATKRLKLDMKGE